MQDNIFLLPYMINKDKDGYFFSDCNGFVIESEIAIEIGKGIVNYAKKHKNDIQKYNNKKREEHEQELNDIKKVKNKSQKDGYIYFFECGGKYKIGYSKKPQERLKQLDKRPFKLNIICISPYLQDAYDYEKELHEYLLDNKIDGEWYELNECMLKIVKEHIENLYDE